MDTKLLTEKYEDEINGVLHCYDRVIISGISNRCAMPKG
jgi:hypothetical protein